MSEDNQSKSDQHSNPEEEEEIVKEEEPEIEKVIDPSFEYDEDDQLIKEFLDWFCESSDKNGVKIDAILNEARGEEETLTFSHLQEFLNIYNKGHKTDFQLDERLIEEFKPEAGDQEEEENSKQNEEPEEEKEEISKEESNGENTKLISIDSKDIVKRVKDYYSQCLIDKNFGLDKIVRVAMSEAFGFLAETTQFKIPTLPIEEYPAFIKQFKLRIFTMFEVSNIKSDFERISSLETLKQELCELELIYLKFLKTIQKCISFYDIVKIFEMTTVFGFSVKSKPRTYPMNKEVRTFFEDVRERNREKLKEIYSLYDFFLNMGYLHFNDFYNVLRITINSQNLKVLLYFRENEEDIFILQNSMKILIRHLNDFYQEAVPINPEVFDKKNYYFNFEIFWDLLYYLVESKKVIVKIEESTKIQELKDSIKALKSVMSIHRSAGERRVFQNDIDNLEAQLNDLLGGGEKNVKIIEKELKIANLHLEEIFHFYCKQQVTRNSNSTFDDYNNGLGNLFVGEWIKFCKDFSLTSKTCNKSVLAGMYKMKAVGSQGIHFKAFLEIVEKLIDKYSSTYGDFTKKARYMYRNMGLYNGTFKSKMKGIRKPFYYSSVVPAMHSSSKGNTTKNTIPKSKKVRMPNFSKNKEVFQRLSRPTKRYNPNNISQNLHSHLKIKKKKNNNYNQRSTEKGQVNQNVSYAFLQRKRNLQENQQKLSWEALEKMKIEDMKGFGNFDLRPEDLVDPNDEEDNIYISDIDIGSHKKTKKNKARRIGEKLEHYGDIVHTYNVERVKTKSFSGQPDKRKINRISRGANRRAQEIGLEKKLKTKEALDMIYLNQNQPKRKYIRN